MYFTNDEDLRNYILDELFNKTYRDLIQSQKFKLKTGIKSLGTLTYYTKKLNIDIEKVYERAKERKRIRDNLTYEEFLKFTKRENILNKIKHDNKVKSYAKNEKLKILLAVAEELGFTFDKNESSNEDYIIECLLNFYSMEDINNIIESKSLS